MTEITRTSLRVAVAGFGWMGEVHARAYSRVLQHFPSLPLAPKLVLVADAAPGQLEQAANRFGCPTTADWQDIVGDETIAAVSICAPNSLHREIAAAVATAGKHIWVEKPVGLTLEDAKAVADVVHAAGVRSAVGFNYRNAPAVQHARKLILDGTIGTPTDAHVRLLADYAAHPSGALSWRFQRKSGGPGVLGDLVSHGIDLATHLLGPVASLISDTDVFIRHRPMPNEYGNAFAISKGDDLGTVENEDYLACLLRFVNGAHGTLIASRVAVGEQCHYGVQVHGTKGALSWDFRRMGELQVSAHGDYLNQATEVMFVGPEHGDLGAFQPTAGVALGFDDLKVIEAANFIRGIAEGRDFGATIDDAVNSAIAIEAMLDSAHGNAWSSLTALTPAPATAAASR